MLILCSEVNIGRLRSLVLIHLIYDCKHIDFLGKWKKKLTRKQLVPILKRYLLFVFIPLHNFSIKVLHIYLVSILLRQHSRSSICIWFLSLVHRSYTRILYVDIMYIVYSTENVKSIFKFEPTLNSWLRSSDYAYMLLKFSTEKKT